MSGDVFRLFDYDLFVNYISLILVFDFICCCLVLFFFCYLLN